jgi:hypothetical protein
MFMTHWELGEVEIACSQVVEEHIRLDGDTGDVSPMKWNSAGDGEEARGVIRRKNSAICKQLLEREGGCLRSRAVVGGGFGAARMRRR